MFCIFAVMVGNAFLHFLRKMRFGGKMHFCGFGEKIRFAVFKGKFVSASLFFLAENAFLWFWREICFGGKVRFCGFDGNMFFFGKVRF